MHNLRASMGHQSEKLTSNNNYFFKNLAGVAEKVKQDGALKVAGSHVKFVSVSWPLSN
jgi:hypothetical protein